VKIIGYAGIDLDSVIKTDMHGSIEARASVQKAYEALSK
jgi:hypothetical protein